MTRKEESAFEVAGVAVRTTNENAQGKTDIPPLWEKFFADNIYEKIPEKQDQMIIGLYTDYESDETKPYTCLVGAKVKPGTELPEGIVSYKVPPAKYEVFEAKGKMPGAIIDMWQKIWQSDLKRTYTGDFEVYDPMLQSESAGEVHIYIAVES